MPSGFRIVAGVQAPVTIEATVPLFLDSALTLAAPQPVTVTNQSDFYFTTPADNAMVAISGVNAANRPVLRIRRTFGGNQFLTFSTHTPLPDAGSLAVDQRYSGNRIQSPLSGTPITDNCFAAAQPGAATSTSTSRFGHTVAVDATDIRFVYSNAYNNQATVSPFENDVDNPTTITVAAAAEVAGVKYKLSFNGAATVAISPGGRVESDPVPVDVTAGTVIYAWTYVSPAAGGNWYANAVSPTPTGGGGGSAQRTDVATVTNASNTVLDASVISTDFGKPVTGVGIPANTYVGTVTPGTSFLLSTKSGSQVSVNANNAGSSVVIGGDLTDPTVAATTIPESLGKFMYVPSQITGRPLSPIAGGGFTPVILCVGDSIITGSNDASSALMTGRSVGFPDASGGGFTARALWGKFPMIQTGVSGDQASIFLTAPGHARRWGWASAATTMFCNYGRNDLSNGRTLAQIQADLISIWTMGARRGLRVIQYTITPYMTSTDGWITLVNQTPVSAPIETIRVQLNAWIRDGAPITPALLPAPAGSSTAIRSESANHPLHAYFEVADLAESARDSGKWTVSTGRSVADASTTSGNSTLNTASGNFTAADLGSTVTVAGAGTAGALLVAQIIAILSSTGVTLHTTAGTTVSAAAATIGTALTRDGLHPGPQLSKVLVGAIDLTRII